MNNEENKTIEYFKNFIENDKKELKLCNEFEDYPVNEEIELLEERLNNFEIILKLIKKQKLKINQQKRLLDIQEREISKQLKTIDNQKEQIEKFKKENLAKNY